MTAQALAAGVNTILAGAGFPVVGAGDPAPPPDDVVRVYDGQVPGTAPAAFVVVTHQLPDVVQRSEGRSRLAHRCYVLVTVTAPTAQGVRTAAQRVIDALEGARPVAAGWLTTPLAVFNTRPPVEDRDVQPAGGRYPMYAKVEIDYTATLV